MPVGYGSIFELPKLSAEEVGSEPDNISEGSLWTLFTGIITGIASLFTAGLGTIPAIGIGLAGAGINTGVQAATQGDINPTFVGIDFISALLPGVSGARNFFKGAAAETKLSEMAGRASKISDSIHSTGQVIAGRPVVSLSSEGTHFLDRLGEVGRRIGQNPTSGVSLFNKGTQNVGKGLGDINSLTKNFIEGNKTLISRATGVAARGSQAVADTTSDILEGDAKVAQRGGITDADIARLVVLTEDIFNSDERLLAVTKYLRDIGKLDSIPFIENLTDEGLLNLLKGNKSPVAQNNFRTRLRNFVRALSRPSSAEFNDTFVQKVQLLFDGNDAGRAPIEFGYKKVKNYIDKEFKRLAKILNKANKLEEAFEETGGMLVNSEVILGYKEIQQVELGSNKLIQIVFYPEPTRSAKNPQGKEPVYVFANKYQLKSLRRNGMHYYLKTWATSKNGRGTLFERGVKSIFGGLTFFTGFFKINAIRNILSLASNMSTGFFGKGGISEHGAFTGAWEKKFAQSFSRNWKNRLGRLIGRAFIGGAGKAFFGHVVGSFIGQEAQRAASQYIVPALTGQKVGDFRKAFLTSIQSNVRRYSRHRTAISGKRNFALERMSNIRKGQIVQRIPGAFTAQTLALSQFRIKIPR